MKSHVWNRIVLAALAAGLISMTSVLLAQEKRASPAKPESASHAAEETCGGPREGIKVHGQWTIVIKNPDGSVASHNEFENALRREGALALVSLLTQPPSAISWRIQLNLKSQLPVVTPDLPGGNVNETVVIGTSLKFPNVADQITGVSTYLDSTGSSGNVSFPFTSRDLTQPIAPSTAPPPPINVQSGQTVDVSVVFSFS